MPTMILNTHDDFQTGIRPPSRRVRREERRPASGVDAGQGQDLIAHVLTHGAQAQFGALKIAGSIARDGLAARDRNLGPVARGASRCEVRQVFDQDVLPAWKHRFVRDIKRDVCELVDHRSLTAVLIANRILALGSALFSFVIETDSDDDAGLRPPSTLSVFRDAKWWRFQHVFSMHGHDEPY